MAGYTGKAAGCKKDEASQECRQLMAVCLKKPGTICWRCEHFLEKKTDMGPQATSHLRDENWAPRERRPNFDAY